MKPEKVFKRYDIRGEYPEEIDEEFAEKLGKAMGAYAARNSNGRVAVCKDTKDTSEVLKQKFIDGLKQSGTLVLDAGKGPTDFAALTGAYHNAISVQVTSSHMPLNFNGFKFMYPEGNGFVNEDLDEVKRIFREEDFEDGLGEFRDVSEVANDIYREKVVEYFTDYFDRIDGKVVLETMGGGSKLFLPELLESLGADLYRFDDEEPRIDPPNPKPELLQHVEEKVEEMDAKIGLANDMDADRVAVYYNGRWLDGNTMFSVLIDILEPERVVASIDTSHQVEDVAEKYGEIDYTRVGDPFVVQRMLDNEAEFSAEPNGHYCFNGFVAYNSGTMAALLLAAADLDSSLGNLPEYANERESIPVNDKVSAMEKLKEAVKESYNVLSEIDGIKFEVGDAVVLVRTSGSSQKIRVIADARDPSEAENAVQETLEMIQKE